MRKSFIGLRFNHLTVVEFVRDDFTSGGKKRPIYRLRCDCGTDVVSRIYSVTAGTRKSCGCASVPFTKHGACKGKRLTPEWRAWRDMLTRAKNPNISHAKSYIDRGIGVDPSWDYGGDGNGFQRFLDHIGPKPSPSHSVDRIDNDRGYFPGNVRWATPTMQARNTTRTRIVSWRGKSMPLVDASEVAGIKYSIVLQRIAKLGWSVDRALSAPPRPDCRRNAA